MMYFNNAAEKFGWTLEKGRRALGQTLPILERGCKNEVHKSKMIQTSNLQSELTLKNWEAKGLMSKKEALKLSNLLKEKQ